MNNVVGLGIFAVGIVLLISGFAASQSLATEVSRVFSGGSGDRSIWLVFAGAISVIGGLALAMRGSKRIRP